MLDSAREDECGLPGMRKRAAHIGARLRVRSHTGAGTEIELSVPGAVAFKDSTVMAQQTGESV